MKKLFLGIVLLVALQSLSGTPLAEQFRRAGYAEIGDFEHRTVTFDCLYTYFEELIEFFQTHSAWAQKLYSAKERFIRSKERNYYSTDFFGFYDESEREGRDQISFYYSPHFHEFICLHYPEFSQIPQVARFFQACLEIQQPCAHLFQEVAMELGLETIFSSEYDRPPILFKVIKYLPSYAAKRPHYDGTAFSLFLNSTDNQALLLSPYKPSLTMEDFSSPLRAHTENSILLIPGALLTEFFLYPTPHIVVQSGKMRYATVAFAMRPHYIPSKIQFAPLPYFQR